ncbi:hypothetical protein QAD02_007027 [Eretmocerus hayati]|uniref:Uncharacterized protein n=1 Tax=Eretmocerus hayati TaxID=131215 RepID=A0ACC2N2G1_9HYME|nr:hypothetical protein QAD02_007027 [Eretmocerus hayati]
MSPASSSSNSTLRRCSGKESKERRNRERLGLMQGAGSEFSLAKDEDLELDYYDYNVVNAAAAPGSYLGMDPAFLVWIPPFDPDADPDSPPPEEPHYEEIPERVEGEPSAESTCANGRPLSKLLDPGDCRLHDEIIQEYKARLSEGALPGQPFRDDDAQDSSGSQKKKKRAKKMKKRRRVQKGPSERALGEVPTSAVNDLDTPRARRRLAAELNAATPTTAEAPGESLALSEIQKQPPPMKPPRKSQIEPKSDGGESKKQSLVYDYIAGAADAIKFADEDEDEPYADNKAAA